MNHLFLAGLGCAGLLLLSPDAAAHGGQYRGPGDVVPPGGGGNGGARGPTTPGGGGSGGPHGPATPRPAAPGTGGPAGPGGGGGLPGPITGRGGVALDDDLTGWDYWWEFNKDPYIRLKDSIWSQRTVTGGADYWLGSSLRPDSHDTLAPSRADKVDVILPALKKAIDSTDQRDINSSCMIAMAKVGVDHRDFTLREVFAPRLATADQEVRESAALALGIAGLADPATIHLLADLLADNAEGRRRSGGNAVNDRTRAFAAYGLGLLAHATTGLEVKRAVFDALRRQLEDGRESSRNLKVAAILGMSLLNVPTIDAPGQQLVADVVGCLRAYYDRDLGVGEQLMQAHVPVAIARLLQGHPDRDLVAQQVDGFAAELAGRRGKARTSDDLSRSAALALGRLCDPIADEAAPGHAHGELLRRTWHDHRDAQTRYFSILALGQIGGEWSRSVLLREFDRGSKALEKPWVAMAMGVYAFEKYAESASSPQLEAEFGRVLSRELEAGGNPEAMAAFAVALGLVRYDAAGDLLLAQLQRHRAKDDLAGYLCIGLALMNHGRAREDIRAIAKASLRRPELLKQAAVALGKLGDKDVARDLLDMLEADGNQTLAKLSAVASALGFIGDRRTIHELVAMLQDRDLNDLSRAFAAVALGGVGDKDPLPWNSKLAADGNYRASVETLTNGQSGILDIL